MNAILTRHEQASAGEEPAIAEILARVKANRRKPFPPGRGALRRDAHPKHRGVLRAERGVEPNLVREFAPGGLRSRWSSPAWVRFSNASAAMQADQPRLRGGMSRRRRAVCRAILPFRHDANGGRAAEPTGAARS